VPAYNPAAGVTAHTALTDKEVAGVIDHADDSVTLAKILHGIDLSTIGVAALARILKAALPAAGVANRVQLDALNRPHRDTGAVWEAFYGFDLVAPLGAPKWDAIVNNMAAGAFAHLAQIPNTPYVYYLPRVGERALFNLLSNIDTTTYLLSLMSFTNQTLAVRPANTGMSMPTPIIQSRYIFYPQGFSAAGTRGTNLYRYDLWTNAWATMAAITTLNANYRFNAAMGVVWDGGDYIYCIGGYDTVADQATFRYSISGNSWAELADFPLGAVTPTGGIEILGDYIYVTRCGGTVTFYRYQISTDSWQARADLNNAITNAGLLLNPDNTDQLINIGGSGGVARVEAYSISGNSWSVWGNTNGPTDMAGKGHYYSKPAPHILVHRYATNYLYLYKLP